jgi:hypothetical protein
MQRKFIFKAAVMAALRPVGNRHLSFSGFRKGSEKSAAFLFVAAGTDIWALPPRTIGILLLALHPVTRRFPSAAPFAFLE